MLFGATIWEYQRSSASTTQPTIPFIKPKPFTSATGAASTGGSDRFDVNNTDADNGAHFEFNPQYDFYMESLDF